jgi:hypothetical protein
VTYLYIPLGGSRNGVGCVSVLLVRRYPV